MITDATNVKRAWKENPHVHECFGTSREIGNNVIFVARFGTQIWPALVTTEKKKSMKNWEWSWAL